MKNYGLFSEEEKEQMEIPSVDPIGMTTPDEEETEIDYLKSLSQRLKESQKEKDLKAAIEQENSPEAQEMRDKKGIWGELARSLGTGLSEYGQAGSGEKFKKNTEGVIESASMQKLKDLQARLASAKGERKEGFEDEMDLAKLQAQLAPKTREQNENEWKSAGDGLLYRTKKDGGLELHQVGSGKKKDVQLSRDVADRIAKQAAVNNIPITTEQLMQMDADNLKLFMTTLPSASESQIIATPEQISAVNNLRASAGLDLLPTGIPISQKNLESSRKAADSVIATENKLKTMVDKYGAEEAVVRHMEESVANLEKIVGKPIEQWDEKKDDLPGVSIPLVGRLPVPTKKYSEFAQAQETLVAPLRHEMFGSALTATEIKNWYKSVGEGKFSTEAAMISAYKQLKNKVKEARKRQSAAPSIVKDRYGKSPEKTEVKPEQVSKDTDVNNLPVWEFE